MMNVTDESEAVFKNNIFTFLIRPHHLERQAVSKLLFQCLKKMKT